MKTVIWLKSAPRTLWARWHYLTLGLLLFAVNCISVFLLLKNQSFTCGPDQVDYLASLFFRISNDIASGGITAGLYSPQFHCGLPHADNPNFHPLYPFYFNWLHADQSIYETIRRLDVIVLIHLAILGTGIGLIARSLSGSWPIAIAAGAVAPYFPAIMSAAQWPQIIASLAWVPFVLLYQIRIAHRPKAYAPAILLGVTASLLIYAQPAQNLVLATVASVIFWLVHFTYLAIGHSKNKIEKLKITLWRLSLSMTIVMTLCGEYLMNLVWFHSLSIRWLGGDLGSVTGNAPVPKAALLEHSMSLVMQMINTNPRSLVISKRSLKHPNLHQH